MIERKEIEKEREGNAQAGDCGVEGVRCRAEAAPPFKSKQ
jgi:hypothetical protein